MTLRLRLGRRIPAVKHACLECQSRRALFRSRGIVKWDRYHTLCFQCYRRHLDRRRAVEGAGVPVSLADARPDRPAVA